MLPFFVCSVDLDTVYDSTATARCAGTCEIEVSLLSGSDSFATVRYVSMLFFSVAPVFVTTNHVVNSLVDHESSVAFTPCCCWTNTTTAYCILHERAGKARERVEVHMGHRRDYGGDDRHERSRHLGAILGQDSDLQDSSRGALCCSPIFSSSNHITVVAVEAVL